MTIKGHVEEVIEELGKPVAVYNPEGGGGRTPVDYGFNSEPDGYIMMVSERRGMPQVFRDSSGDEVETQIEYRYVPEEPDPETGETSQPEIIPAGDSHPTVLSPEGPLRYRVLSEFIEDSGVAVLAVVEQ